MWCNIWIFFESLSKTIKWRTFVSDHLKILNRNGNSFGRKYSYCNVIPCANKRCSMRRKDNENNGQKKQILNSHREFGCEGMCTKILFINRLIVMATMPLFWIVSFNSQSRYYWLRLYMWDNKFPNWTIWLLLDVLLASTS